MPTYGMPAEVVDDVFDQTDRVLGDPSTHIVLATQHGIPSQRPWPS